MNKTKLLLIICLVLGVLYAEDVTSTAPDTTSTDTTSTETGDTATNSTSADDDGTTGEADDDADGDDDNDADGDDDDDADGDDDDDADGDDDDDDDDDDVITVKVGEVQFLDDIDSCEAYNVTNPSGIGYNLSISNYVNIQKIAFTDYNLNCTQLKELNCSSTINGRVCYSININSTDDGQTPMDLNPSGCLQNATLWIVKYNETEEASLDIEFNQTMSNCVNESGCLGLDFAKCYDSSDCLEGCAWSACRSTKLSSRGEAQVQEGLCISADSQNSANSECSNDLVFWATTEDESGTWGQVSWTSPDNTTVLVCESEDDWDSWDGALGITIIVIVALIVLLLLCSAYYRWKLSSSKQAPFTAPGFCPSFLFPPQGENNTEDLKDKLMKQIIQKIYNLYSIIIVFLIEIFL